MSEHVTLKDLSGELGMDRSHLRRYVLARGFSPVRVRTQESRGQLTLALTAEDAESLKEMRESEGYVSDASVQGLPVADGSGWFYAIQLVPELDPSRVKLGFASDVDQRLKAHQTAAPTARVIKAWSCKRSWEHAAIDCLARIGNQIANEVYTFTDLDEMVRLAEAFFELMPEG